MNAFNTENKIYIGKFRKKELVIHILFWAIYLLFPFLKTIGRNDYPYHFYSELNDLIFGIVVFYTAYLIAFSLKNKLKTFLFLLLLFLVVGYVNFSIHNSLFGGVHDNAYSYYAISYFSKYTILTLFAFVLYSTKASYHKHSILEEALQKKQQAELLGLKSQINPHFLFNTLNTIYSSALKKDDNTPEMILKLSDNFRYLLQDGQEEYVSISKEIAHLRDYISLQKIRLAEKVKVNFEINIDDNNQKIAPLLLISFVENAFKYVNTLRGNCHKIDVILRLEKQNLIFSCQNPYNKNAEHNIDSKWKESGIGISNTKKRLSYLYPDKHLLKIKDENETFNVMLQIQL